MWFKPQPPRRTEHRSVMFIVVVARPNADPTAPTSMVTEGTRIVQVVVITWGPRDPQRHRSHSVPISHPTPLTVVQAAVVQFLVDRFAVKLIAGTAVPQPPTLNRRTRVVAHTKTMVATAMRSSRDRVARRRLAQSS